MVQTVTKPTYAFIDSQNVNLGVKSQGWKLDFKKFRKFLAVKYQVKKAFLFIGYLPKNDQLYQSLTEYGYILVYKPVVKYNKSRKPQLKGNVDAELVLHTMIEYPHYQSAVIVSGDDDFHCLIEYLANHQKLKKIITPNQRFSSLLKKYNDQIIALTQLKNKLQYQQKERHSRGI